MLEMDEPVL